MIVKCFKIECLTNLHVGNGENNYNIIDKEVEKDPILQTPTIYASGVKGALREHLQTQGCSQVDEMFGKPLTKGAAEFTTGKIKILSANLLALPMRATRGDAFYYLVSSQELLENFRNLNRSFSIDLSIDPVCSGQVQVEGKDCAISDETIALLDAKLALMSAADFKNIPLPVVARNRIHGHKNLWYEEFVPHKSVFYFYALSLDADLLETFAEDICKAPVQFGGNASVGCGYTKISVIGGAEK